MQNKADNWKEPSWQSMKVYPFYATMTDDELRQEYEASVGFYGSDHEYTKKLKQEIDKR